MKFKDGVVLALLPGMSTALPWIDAVHQRLFRRDATVTSGADGSHEPESLHYKGLAIDLRTRDLTGAESLLLVHALREALDTNYDVVLESDHIHIEFDPG